METPYAWDILEPVLRSLDAYISVGEPIFVSPPPTKTGPTSGRELAAHHGLNNIPTFVKTLRENKQAGSRVGAARSLAWIHREAGANEEVSRKIETAILPLIAAMTLDDSEEVRLEARHALKTIKGSKFVENLIINDNKSSLENPVSSVEVGDADHSSGPGAGDVEPRKIPSTHKGPHKQVGTTGYGDRVPGLDERIKGLIDALRSVTDGLPDDAEQRATALTAAHLAYRQELAIQLEPVINVRIKQAIEGGSSYEEKKELIKSLNEELRLYGLAVRCEIPGDKGSVAVHPGYFTADSARREGGRLRVEYWESGRPKRLGLTGEPAIHLMPAPSHHSRQLTDPDAGSFVDRTTAHRSMRDLTR